jgi:hypothetical protein
MNSSFRFILLAILICAAAVQAQPVINASDFPTSPGTTQNFGKTSSTVAVNLGPAGVNQTWNFSSMTTDEAFTWNWVVPSTTPQGSHFPTANICNWSHDLTENSDSYAYYTLTSNVLTPLGIATSNPDTFIVYTNQTAQYSFPISYNTSWYTAWTMPVVPNLSFVRDSTYSTVDAWGTLTDLTGTHPCLRIKNHAYIMTYVLGNLFQTITNWDYTWIVPSMGLVVNISSANNEPNPNFTTGKFERQTGASAVRELPISQMLPTSVELEPVYPNPFNATTVLTFSLPMAGDVNLSVFDASGREVSGLAQGHYQPGVYQVEFNGANLSSGTYFARLTANGFETTRSLTLLK